MPVKIALVTRVGNQLWPLVEQHYFAFLYALFHTTPTHICDATVACQLKLIAIMTSVP